MQNIDLNKKHIAVLTVCKMENNELKKSVLKIGRVFILMT